ncbi:MAG: hypothetical protein UR30_C0005G0039 [Candidatus Peregrinibacteria bacterium GW2011_GWC2_33_13]|nr:MAG: hypothetical protein UR30_C0005G0039 [Candidatus Peregrinibacteria bacterium GW2011_GWC2_33_13]
MKLINKYINKITESVASRITQIIDNKVMSSLENLQKSLGRIETRQLVNTESDLINDYEFKVFSQWGEDGIIQYLINKIPIKNKIFVEFGVENYKESNTRFLLQNNNWSGLVIDGSEQNIKQIKSEDIYWRYNLKAEHSFITRDNINEIILNSGIKGDIGILSIDIDGNDYWVWESINVVSPAIVICEYNSLFGSSDKIVIPYKENFERNKEHYSMLYFGASISAFNFLAEKKGYSLVGSNLAGNNLFFVRNDLVNNLKVLTPQEAYQKSMFRESRNTSGELTFANFNERYELIKDIDVINLDANKLVKISDIYVEMD